MKKLSFFCLLLPLCFASVGELNAGGARTEPEETQEEVIWVGPGWYYGIWFDNEEDFYAYRESRYHHGEHYHEEHHQQRHENHPSGGRHH